MSSEEFKWLAEYWRRCRDNLASELEKLRRHEVYRIWDDFGQSLYVGQQTDKGESRLVAHIRENKSSVQQYLTKLQSSGKGFYMATIYKNLTELEANELETIHIMGARNGNINIIFIIYISEPVCRNEASGREAERLRGQPDINERIAKERRMASEILNKIRKDPANLITDDNVALFIQKEKARMSENAKLSDPSS